MIKLKQGKDEILLNLNRLNYTRFVKDPDSGVEVLEIVVGSISRIFLEGQDARDAKATIERHLIKGE